MALCSFVTKGVVVAHVVLVRNEVDSSHAESSDEMVGVHPVPLLHESVVSLLVSGSWICLSGHADSSDEPKGADVLKATHDTDRQSNVWEIKLLELVDLGGDSTELYKST